MSIGNLSHLLRFLAVPVLCACTYVPFDAPREPRPAPGNSGRTHAERRIAEVRSSRAGQTAFYPLVAGNDALGARLSLIAAAESQIDIQTFLIKPDSAAALISLALIEAADRGVNVRLLVDDVFTTASDAQIAYLAAHPRISVRLFNPLSRQSPKAMNYLIDFGRVNRRMHNKAFIVDRGVAVIGGRNIADEYYQVDTTTEFADFDLFMAGPAVSDLTHAFEIFWSDRWSVPAGAFWPKEVDPAEVRAGLEMRAAAGAAGVYRRAMGSTYLQDLRSGAVPATWGRARVVSDLPRKLRVSPGPGERRVGDALVQRLVAAKTQVTVISPYFVPRAWGADLFTELAQRGVRVRIVTNSLAANNHPYVHGGYLRHRKALLEAGVELYEVRADVLERLGETAPGSDTQLTMHTKLIIIDEDTSFVGSLNFDPRSININSEMGVFIDGPHAARGFLAAIEEDLKKYAFRVMRTEQGALRWVWSYDNRTEVFSSDPGASLLRKATAGIAAVLPIEGQL